MKIVGHHPPQGGFLPGTVSHEEGFPMKNRCFFSGNRFPEKQFFIAAFPCQGDMCGRGVSLIGLPFALSHSRHSRKKSLHIDRARVDVIANCPCMQMAVLRGYMTSKIVTQRVSLKRSKNRVDLIYFYFDVSPLHVDEKPQWLLSISDIPQFFRLVGPGVLS